MLEVLTMRRRRRKKRKMPRVRIRKVRYGSAEPTWRALQRTADNLRPSISRSLRAAVLRVRQRIDYGALHQTLMNRGTDPGAIDRASESLALVLRNDLRSTVDSVVSLALERSALKALALDQRGVRAAAAKPVRGQFSIHNPLAVKWVREHGAELVDDISEKTRASIRKVLVQSFERGINAQKTAKRVKQVIGLTEKQVDAVERLRDRLIDSPGELVHAGGRDIRVPETIDDDWLEAKLDRYSETLLDARADAIARTETIAAANEGQRQAWVQAGATGLLDLDEVERVWIVTPDDRLCPICESMEGKTASVNGTFVDEEGETHSGPPAHPRCRCAQGLVPRGFRAARSNEEVGLPKNRACLSHFLRTGAFDKKAYMAEYHKANYEKKKEQKAYKKEQEGKGFIGPKKPAAPPKPKPQKLTLPTVSPSQDPKGEAKEHSQEQTTLLPISVAAPRPESPEVPEGYSSKIRESEPGLIVKEVKVLNDAMVKASGQAGITSITNASSQTRIDMKVKINEDISARLTEAHPDITAHLFGPGTNFTDSKDYVKQTVDLWAHTSGDHQPGAVSRQEVIRKEFGIEEEAMSHLTNSKPLSGDRETVARGFVRAEYAATQEFFKKEGITHVSLYRGVGATKGLESSKIGPTGSVADVMMAPASSWSTSREIARGFGGSAGYVMEVRVPVERVLSTSVTGRGCLSEAEVLVLGGATRVHVRRKKGFY